MAFNVNKPTDNPTPATKTAAPVPVPAPASKPVVAEMQFEDFDEAPALVKENKYQDKINEMAKGELSAEGRSKASMCLIVTDAEKTERDLVRKAANVIGKGARTRISKKHPRTNANAPAGMEYMVFWLEKMTVRTRKTESE